MPVICLRTFSLKKITFLCTYEFKKLTLGISQTGFTKNICHACSPFRIKKEFLLFRREMSLCLFWAPGAWLTSIWRCLTNRRSVRAHVCAGVCVFVLTLANIKVNDWCQQHWLEPPWVHTRTHTHSCNPTQPHTLSHLSSIWYSIFSRVHSVLSRTLHLYVLTPSCSGTPAVPAHIQIKALGYDGYSLSRSLFETL